MVTKNSDKLIETNSDKRVSQSVSQSVNLTTDRRKSIFGKREESPTAMRSQKKQAHRLCCYKRKAERKEVAATLDRHEVGHQLYQIFSPVS